MMSFIITRLTPALLTEQFVSYCETLSHLSKIGDLTLEKALIVLQRSDRTWSAIFVAISESTHEIIASGTLLIEATFRRGGKNAAHIENIVTRKGYEWQGIGKAIVTMLIDYAKTQDCYKIIGDCDEELVWRYEKFGFKRDGAFIRQYVN